MPSLYIPVKRRCKTGPKTYLGKRRSSANSLKHGLYARKPHLLRELIPRLIDSDSFQGFPFGWR